MPEIGNTAFSIRALLVDKKDKPTDESETELGNDSNESPSSRVSEMESNRSRAHGVNVGTQGFIWCANSASGQ